MMDTPINIQTTVTSHGGYEFISLPSGCPYRTHCYIRSSEGNTLDVCEYLTYFHDWINPYGVQEYCARPSKNQESKQSV